jgi:serine protease Do
MTTFSSLVIPRAFAAALALVALSAAAQPVVEAPVEAQPPSSSLSQTPSPSPSSAALPDFSLLVERCGPAVVNISTQQGSLYDPQDFGTDEGIPEDSPLYDFFRRFFGDDGEVPQDIDPGRSLGSGFFVTDDGYVLTNAHVVEAADEIIVRTSDRREFLAKAIGADERSDIALLKVEGTDLPKVEIGSAADLKVGEWVLAIGSPFGFEHSATAGIVSAKGRNLPSENYVPFIQTDVAINPGNSGGPLFDLDGRVIGVNSQIYSRTGGFMGLSFAIPIDVAMDVVAQLKTKGRVSRGWLGVLIQDVTRELAPAFGMTQPRGALVSQVLPQSPSEAADLRPGDVILKFNGIDIQTSGNLPPLVGAAKVGSEARIELLREGEIITLSVQLAELPDDESMMVTQGTIGEPSTANRLGLVVKDLSGDLREQLGIAQSAGGVLVDSVEEGPAERGGIRAGDVILRFDRHPVEDTRHFRELLDAAEPGKIVAMLVQRGDGRMFYAIRVPRE